MRAQVHRGRIRIVLEPQDEVPFGQATKAETLGTLIGSLHEDLETGYLSCALSVQNLRRLRREGCKLAEDPHTRQVIAKLKEEYDAYLAESARGDRAKNGQIAINYQFKIKPFQHQIVGFHYLHAMRNPALFGEPGVGKSAMVVFLADSLLKAGEDWTFIVTCPINLIQHVWIDEFERFSDLTALSLREPSTSVIKARDWDEGANHEDPAERKKAFNRARLRRRKLIDERFAADSRVYVVNFEQLRLDPIRKRLDKLCRRHRDAGRQICLIIDESTRIASRTSATYRALKKIRHHCERCIIMSGTPAPNGILGLWAQFDVLDDGFTLHAAFTDYRKEVAVERELKGITWEDKEGKVRTATKWFARPGASLEVYRTIKPRMIRFRTEDCIDLPKSRFIVRDVELNKEQQTAYDEMESMLYTELENQPVTAKVAVAKLMKLREITGGFVISDTREALRLGKDAPKMVELDELLIQSIADKIGEREPSRKALVWAQYQWECHELIKRYRIPYGARGLFGGISTGAKDDAIRRFRTDPSCRLLVCHPASAGHGLTLTEASFAFYYSLSYNFEEFYQSYRRMARAGQTRPMTFYCLVCPGTIDEVLMDILAEKKNFSDFIVDGQFQRDDLLKRRGKSDGPRLDLAISTEVDHESPTTTRQQTLAGPDHDDPAQ